MGLSRPQSLQTFQWQVWIKKFEVDFKKEKVGRLSTIGLSASSSRVERLHDYDMACLHHVYGYIHVHDYMGEGDTLPD